MNPDGDLTDRSIDLRIALGALLLPDGNGSAVELHAWVWSLCSRQLVEQPLGAVDLKVAADLVEGQLPARYLLCLDGGHSGFPPGC